jgi:hypothetical protein
MYANVLTKPLQGSQFVYERTCLTGLKLRGKLVIQRIDCAFASATLEDKAI